MEALNDLVRTGKALYVGASSMYAWQFSAAQYAAKSHGWACFVSMQNHYNLVYREEEREMIPLCRNLGVGTIPWSPLARGWLSGRRHIDGDIPTPRARSDNLARQLYDASDFPVIDVANKLAAERNVPTAQAALGWLLSKPEVTSPIVGATKVTHLDDAVAALGIRLSDDEIRRLETPYCPRSIRGHR